MTTAPLLVLASASPGRAKLLTDAGIDFEVQVSDVDEAAITAEYPGLEPPDVALLLARAKAEAVAALPASDGAVVLGCDSVFELDGIAYGKPYKASVARERWRQMRGRTGVLHTGHWLIDNQLIDVGSVDDGSVDGSPVDEGPVDGSPVDEPEENGRSQNNSDAGHHNVGTGSFSGGSGATVGAVASATVHFASITDAEIEAYVATGEPLPCAGAFTIDGRGGAFITGIDGDPHAVVGLSISTLRELLCMAGVSITDLWK